MNNRFVKKMSLGIVSLSAVVLLAACGDNGTIDDPATEPMEDPVEDPADPSLEPSEEPEEEAPEMDGPGADTP